MSSSEGVPGRVVLECRDFDANLEFFTKQAGFRIDRISPADSPREVDLSGHGLALQLRRGDADSPVIIQIPGEPRGSKLIAPNGTRIEHAPPVRVVDVPPIDQSLVISRIADADDFAAGRAGMGYRDLIPNRQGGRFIASHIRISGGGPVPDYAHFHKIRFQMIYCYRGWVRVAYEDQGEPFVLSAGDCVLQPPEIRHRVLESSAGLEVIEIGCPAEHDTFADHDITLPTGVVAPDRDFGGQRFVRHVAADAEWEPWWLDGSHFECRHIGIAEATGGLAGVRVVRPTTNDAATQPLVHGAEFALWFVLDGAADVALDQTSERLVEGDSVVIPAGVAHALSASPGTQILEVTLPAAVPVV